MITSGKYILYCLFYPLFFFLLYACDEENIHGDTLADGIWKITDIQGVDTTLIPEFSQLLTKQIAFNYCSKSMNKDWGTKNEVYGECWMLLSGSTDHQFTQDEYRFHIRSNEALEIKLLPDHSDRILPDLTGPYTYIIDGRNLALRYTGTDKPELIDLEIHCWDWSPQ